MWKMTLIYASFVVLTSLNPILCQNDDDDETDQDPEDTIVIEVRRDVTAIPLYSSYYMNPKRIVIAYGVLVTVECLGEPANLVMTRDGKQLTTQHTDDTIKWSSNTLNLQTYKFVCADVKTSCRRLVYITVTPALVVVTRNKQFYSDESNNCIVQFGSDVAVLCSGPDVNKLTLKKFGETLPTKDLNETTIQWVVKNLDVQNSEYVCRDVDMDSKSSVRIKVVPMIFIQSQNKTLTPFFNIVTNKHFYSFTYQDSFEIVCAWPRSVILIGPGENNKMVMNNADKNTVKWNISDLKLGTSVYGCADSEDTDLLNKVYIKVDLIVEVISPIMQRVGKIYVVKYGKPVDIICSGPDAAQLKITNRDVNIQTEIVNKTAVKGVMKNAEIYDVLVYCSMGQEKTLVEVEVLPTPAGFRCVSHDHRYLNCSWKALNNQVNFTLFHIENQEFLHVCTKRAADSGPRVCTWDYKKEIKVFSFLMQTCSDLGCYNDTFDMKQASIMKLAPPRHVIVHNSSSRGVEIRWRSTNVGFGGENFWSADGDVLFKVEYWYWGIEPRGVNSSLIFCTNSFCKVDLQLPCPGQYYEAFIYQKLKRSIGEEFWSDPASINFRTDNDELNLGDQSCAWKPKKNKEVMKYFIQELRLDVQDDMKNVQKNVNALKEKLALLRTLREQTP